MKSAPEIIYKVISFINNNGKWQGSATELLNVLDEKDITPQYLTKALNEYSKTILSDNKISFATSRTSSSRLVTLEKDIVEASEGISKTVIISNDNDNNDDDDVQDI